jgi:hypothetical protein
MAGREVTARQTIAIESEWRRERMVDKFRNLWYKHFIIPEQDMDLARVRPDAAEGKVREA